MNDSSSTTSLDSSLEDMESITPEKWQMKELKPWHRQLCSLLAQGIDRQTMAHVLDCTPEYISMLAKQPLIQKYIQDMCQFANLQLEAQFAKSVTVIGDTLENGNYKEKMQAARLQAELTHRVGSGSGIPPEVTDTNDRLLRLADRLLTLQEKVVHSTIIPGESHEIKAIQEI